MLLNNKFCRVLSWYDNEWGFSNRMIDTIAKLKKINLSEFSQLLFFN